MQKTTLIIIIITSVFLISYDIFAAYRGEVGSTISEVILDEALKHPIVPFALGIICGHFFWSQN